jgi:hypothetical protein
MKQIIAFVHRLVYIANVAMGHQTISPGKKANEPLYAMVRVRQQSHLRR